MMDYRGTDRAETLGLFFRLNALAVSLPFGVVVIALIYERVTGDYFTRSQWKTLVMVLWICTLLALAREALKRKRSGSKFQDLLQSEHSAGAWETTHSRRLGTELLLLGLGIPLGALAVTVSAAHLMGIEITAADWKMVVGILWVSAICLLIRHARRAYRR